MKSIKHKERRETKNLDKNSLLINKRKMIYYMDPVNTDYYKQNTKDSHYLCCFPRYNKWSFFQFIKI